MRNVNRVLLTASLISSISILLLSVYVSAAYAVGFSGVHCVRVHMTPRLYQSRKRLKASTSTTQPPKHGWGGSSRYGSRQSKQRRKKLAGLTKKKRAKVAEQKTPVRPQDYIAHMSSATLAPGVVHKIMRGPLTINLIDVDLLRAPVKVRPVLAGNCFDRLKDVRLHAQESKALAAVNANYFKPGGTPLGTLIIDGEWISGPLYERVSMGITDSGKVLMDRVSLHGILKTSDPTIPDIWINNINQPRRKGCRLIAYTRRWGSHVRMPYAGCLVAIDAKGEVIDKATTVMEIPWGGYVLSDSKYSAISQLRKGDIAYISWNARPAQWHSVIQAVSGGPTLIRDGKLYLDLQDQKFKKSWTSSRIRARTACGITADRHLLLATIEGPHTLWDVAKFFHKLGAVDAMNLDGGGSTTMVVKGAIVTRNAKSNLRRVASTLAIVDECTAVNQERLYNTTYIPRSDLSRFDSVNLNDQTPLIKSYEIPPIDGINADLSQIAKLNALPPSIVIESNSSPKTP